MTSVPGLQVHLSTAANQHFEGLCTDLDSNNRDLLALVAFSPQRAPAIAIGDKARLAFRGAGLVSAIDSEGTTILRTDDQAQRCYSFQLGDMPKSLLLLLANRRGSTRLTPRGGVRIQLLDLPRGVLPEVALHDVSGTGLSIIVEPALEQALLEHVRLRLSIAFPGEERMEIVTAIRHRRMHKSNLLYGLEFDGHIPELMRAQERFLAYLTGIR